MGYYLAVLSLAVFSLPALSLPALSLAAFLPASASFFGSDAFVVPLSDFVAVEELESEVEPFAVPPLSVEPVLLVEPLPSVSSLPEVPLAALPSASEPDWDSVPVEALESVAA